MSVRIDVLRDAVLSWHIPAAAPLTRGGRLYMDAPRGSGQLSATVRNIMRTNPRLSAVDALLLAETHAARRPARRDRSGIPRSHAARRVGLRPTCDVVAGAVGIGQFMVGTADLYGLDPFDPDAAIDATARRWADTWRGTARGAGAIRTHSRWRRTMPVRRRLRTITACRVIPRRWRISRIFLSAGHESFAIDEF